MWLICSSLGKKLIMSITGISLILFLLFHMLMNLVALIPANAEGIYPYNVLCALLGANWYALIAAKGLAVLSVVHIGFAFWLYFSNRKARGSDYAVTARPKEVEWASQNMLALGIVIFVFLVFHLYHFWAKMQLVEVLYLLGMASSEAYAKATEGIYFLRQIFSNPIWVIFYLVAFVALWFHLTHGFWSALQSMGINNQKWFNRLRIAGNAFVTFIMLGFSLVVVVFYIQSLLGCGTACVL